MDEDQLPNQSEETTGKPYIFSDEKTKKKIKRHISDIDDVISENDIKDAKIPGGEKPVKGRRGKKDAPPKEDKNPEQDEGAGNPVTPWDVISE